MSPAIARRVVAWSVAFANMAAFAAEPPAAPADNGQPQVRQPAHSPTTIAFSTSSSWSQPMRADAAAGFDDIQPPKRTADWLIAPIPFRSSLLGWGMKLGVLRLYPPDADTPPDRQPMYGTGGMYADSGSWGAAAFDKRYWSAGRWRSIIAAGVGELNYSLTLGPAQDSISVPVRQQARGAMLQVDRSVLGHGWIGMGVQQARSPISLRNLPDDIAGLVPQITYRMWVIDLGAEWDTRSDPFYPRSGTYATLDVEPSRSTGSIGGLGLDSNFIRYKLTYNGFHPIRPQQVLAWRFYAENVPGDAPFFAMPWFGSGADLRGYSPGTYAGHTVLAAQAEWRWELGKRLGAVVFAGAGSVQGEVTGFRQSDWLPAAGAGLRLRVSKDSTINMRLDYARGRNDSALLISVGEAF